MALIGGLGRDGRIEIDIDDVIECPDGDANGVAQLFVVEGAIVLQV